VGLNETIDLAVGETETFTQTYTPSEDEIVEGEVENTVTVSAPDPNDPDGDPIEDKDTITTDVTEKDAPSLLVEKEGTYNRATGEVSYTITVTNNGNIDLTDIVVNDDKVGLYETIDLAAGDEETFTQTYTPSEEEIAEGEVENTVTVSAPDPDDPDGDPIEDKDTIITDIDEKDLIDLAFTKIAKVEGDKDVAELGDKITYTFTIENTGNVDLTNLSINDPMDGLD